MDNFFFGLESIGQYIKYSILFLFQLEIVWGFAIGFAASTLIHLFITLDNPRHLPRMIARSATNSFHKTAPRAKDGTYLVSYTEFEEKHHRVRIVFYSAVLAFLAIVIISLVRY